ncbi:hypothetical protein F0L17_13370 [Streptomyces sp. TRM43335]|uniref:Secreted protein n=1 Tax=Streptomyces taklimakanensis TaxID=2569853 RepID=A0A6G2BCT4_9ACTN|nr:hypothetical protein [Streptomyces taklimakanensis]MTE20091.1 hypothetical protein [Streptomyces taklimakanensis]
MDEPQQCASNLRAIALASGVALAAILPLAVATAGQDGPASAEGAGGRSRPAAAVTTPAPSAPSGPVPGAGPSEVTAVCGRPSTAPRGVGAQTCVLSRNGVTWGRMYYRNTTGEPLYGALSLLGPGGHSVTVSCEMPAAGGSGVCDTPRRGTERTREDDREKEPEADPYTAIAEVAAPDGEGLLLRSGSEFAP